MGEKRDSSDCICALSAQTLDLEGIQNYIKIRYPVLMLDGATVFPGERAEGYKMLTGNELFWQGHYPEYPIMPGTYQLEALAQLFSLTFLTHRESGALPKLAGFENVRFYKEVKPGCRLDMEAELKSKRHGLAKGEARAFVNNEIVCSAEIKTVIG